MKHFAVVGVALCVCWLGAACRTPRETPTSARLPNGVLTPERIPASTQMPVGTRVPLPTPVLDPLTDAEAVALLEEKLTHRYGVAPETLRIEIRVQPRRASVRYASPYDVTEPVFRAQATLVALASARVLVRVNPMLDGGISVAVIPERSAEVGLWVTVIAGSSLEAWMAGSISESEFSDQWSLGTIPRE